MEGSAGDPKQAVRLVRKPTEQDKVFAIVGPCMTAEYEMVAPVPNELKVPDIVTIYIKAGIMAANRPWAFRVSLTADIILSAAIDAFEESEV